MFLTYKLQSARIVFMFLIFFVVTSIGNVYSQSNQIQRVRINFTSPDNYVRQLLLGFTPNDAATDGFDWGYDARNPDNFPNDLNWIIEDDRYVIQGVGSFADTKSYPLGLFLSDAGSVAISLHSLENFDFDVQVFIYDALLNQHTLLNNYDFTGVFEQGDYLNRLYVTFSNNSYPQALSVAEVESNKVLFEYHRGTKMLVLKSNNQQVAYLQEVNFYDLSGKRLSSYKLHNESSLNLAGFSSTNNIVLCKVKSNLGEASKLLIL